MKLLNWIKSLFSGETYQNNLDIYVASKHPTTVSEVEHWIKDYDHKTARGF